MDANINGLKNLLESGGVARSLTVRYSRTSEIAMLAKTAGFDTLFVDLEHAPLSTSEMSQICIAAQMIGVTPLVRIPGGRFDLISLVLDGGALGVIVPHVRSAADAEAAVTAAYFPPRGTRSPAGPAAQFEYRSIPIPEANQALNDATLVMVMVETEEAIEHVEEIAAVDGVDVIMIGTNDLLGDLGIPAQYEHPKLAAAYKKVIDAAQQNGKYVGTGGLSTRLDLAKHYVELGARYISVGTDIGFLIRGAKGALADVAV